MSASISHQHVWAHVPQSVGANPEMILGMSTVLLCMKRRNLGFHRLQLVCVNSHCFKMINFVSITLSALKSQWSLDTDKLFLEPRRDTPLVFR